MPELEESFAARLELSFDRAVFQIFHRTSNATLRLACCPLRLNYAEQK